MGEFYNLQLNLQPSESQSLGVEAAPWKTFTRSQAIVLCSMGCGGGGKITGLKKYSDWLMVFKSGDRSFHKKAEKCKSNKKNRPQERRDEERKKGMILGGEQRGGAALRILETAGLQSAGEQVSPYVCTFCSFHPKCSFLLLHHAKAIKYHLLCEVFPDFFWHN